MKTDLSSAYVETMIPGVKILTLKAPISAQFEITSQCNYGCRFCYNVWKDGNHAKTSLLTYKQKDQIVDKIISMEVFSLIFSGGEPLMDKDLLPLLNKCHLAKIETMIITNGALLTEAICTRLKEYNLHTMQISLHHYDPKKNDWLTQTAGSHALTVRGIRTALKVLGTEMININMVVTSYNYRDVLPMATFLAGLGVKNFSFSSLSSTGSALTNAQTLSQDQFKKAFSSLLSAQEYLGINVNIVGGFPFCTLLPIHPEPWRFSANFCDAGLNQLVIASNGDIRPCVCYPQVIGNLLKDDPRELWSTSAFIRSLQCLEHVPKGCYTCEHVAVCKGGCRASAWCSTGKLDAPEPLGGPQ